MEGAVSFGQTFDAGTPLASITRYRAEAVAPRHRHDEPYIAVVLRGGFRQSWRSDRLASAGELVVLPAGAWHSDTVGPQGSTCLNLHLQHNSAEQLLPISGKLTFQQWTTARQIASEVAQDQLLDSLALESLIHEFIGVLGGERDSFEWERVKSLAEWIASEPRRSWRLSDAAEVVSLHPTHLARAFRRKTGQSLGAFRRAHVMLELCLTLRSSDRSLADIASEFGFADQAHMSRAFKRHTGMPPARYRRRFRR